MIARIDPQPEAMSQRLEPLVEGNGVGHARKRIGRLCQAGTAGCLFTR